MSRDSSSHRSGTSASSRATPSASSSPPASSGSRTRRVTAVTLVDRLLAGSAPQAAQNPGHSPQTEHDPLLGSRAPLEHNHRQHDPEGGQHDLLAEGRLP